MNGDEKVVVEHMSAAMSVYYLPHCVSACEMTALTDAVNASDDILQQMGEQGFAAGMPEDVKQALATDLAKKVANHGHTCSFGEDLAKIEHAEVKHGADKLIIGVNPANPELDRSNLHRQVMKIISKHLGIDSLEAELWKPTLY